MMPNNATRTDTRLSTEFLAGMQKELVGRPDRGHEVKSDRD